MAMEVCYLCGKEMAKDDLISDDHAVARQLITRNQPKAKGFDYGGVLSTHEKCNNEFGPEKYCLKALKIISILNDESCVCRVQHKDDPSIVVMAINESCLKELTQRDLKFFKFIDVRKNSIEEISAPAFFSGKPKVSPMRDALFTALAVLTKSAAALLVARHLREVPTQWKILAIPYRSTSGALNLDGLDELFGGVKPFDIGVKVWLKPFDSGDWIVFYCAHNILVIFLFQFSESNMYWNKMIEQFQDAEKLYFEGAHLNMLINYQWKPQ